jgi:tetratricopeptide (TPR) repeat protein
MTAEEVRAELRRCHQLPNGRAKAQRLESLAAQARDTGDHHVEAEVLISLSNAYEYSSERERIPLPVGRVLQLLDRFPAEVADLSHTIHWHLKWLTGALIDNPEVPLPTIYRWLDECESRYRQCGYSPRPVHAHRSRLARSLGDDVTASAEIEAAIAATRDQMSDCAACEQNGFGEARAAAGDDAGALEQWRPVLDGSKRCMEEPHRTLARALLPLLRVGRADDARSAFLRGYEMARHNISLMPSVGRHIEFCALTGNEPRGLEILAAHSPWLADSTVDAATRLSFIGGVRVLLGRLDDLGHGGVGVGAGTVRAALTAIDAEISELCARYDARNGNKAVSDRVAARLGQPPVLDFLPLGRPVRLPQPQPQPATATATPSRPSSLPARPDAATLEDLIAEARRLTELRHPDARTTWTQVSARALTDGVELPADVVAGVKRSDAGHLMTSDPAAARSLLLEVAVLSAALGDLDRDLEARAAATLTLELSGDHAAARDAIAALRAEAEAAFASGELTARHYLNVRVNHAVIEVHALDDRPDRLPADVTAAAEAAGDALAAADRLGQPHHAGRCQELLMRTALWQEDRPGMVAALTGARDAYLAAGEPWHAARPTAMLAELTLRDGDPQTAERLVLEAIRDGAAVLDRPEIAQLSSLLTETIARQPGREIDFADAALTAAARWDGISAPDTLHNTFNAARAYQQLGRHGDAAALFAQVIPEVDVPYDVRTVAMTREQYGRSLTAIERHREAAEQFLEAARLIADDQDNSAAHANVAWLAAEALRRSGQLTEARAAFLRTAELFAALGDTVPRVRCLRSAAWLDFGPAPDQPPGAERPRVSAMRSVLAELEAATTTGDQADLAPELEATRKQLDAMLAEPDEDEDEDEDAEAAADD